MAYIGKEPIVGNFQKCDALTATTTADYTLQVSSTNVVPESVNHMLVSLNGILQAPTTSFTVSSSTLTFVSNLATGDVIDFVILLGNVLDLGTVSDGTITNAKLAQDIISGETALASEPADTDEFLVSDAGTLKRIDYSLIKASNTPAFEASMSAFQNISDATVTKITFDVETYDSDGTYDHATNYRFTPAVAGKYFVYLQVKHQTSGNYARSGFPQIYKNGSVHVGAYNSANDDAPGINMMVYVHATIDMDADDYLEAYTKFDVTAGNCRVGKDSTSIDNTFFGAFKLIT